MAHSTFSILENGSDYGTNSNTTLADNLSQFSVSSWFKTTNGSSSIAILVAKWQDAITQAHHGWSLHVNNVASGHKLFFMIRSATDYVVTTSSSVIDGNWHNIVATYDSVLGSHLYLDGNDVTTFFSGSPGANFSNSFPLAFGDRTGAPNFDWIGQVDDTRIWNTVLSSSDAALIASGGDPVSIPIAYWKMEEGSGVTLGDSTGNGNIITFNALSWSTNVPLPLSTLTLTLSDSISSSDATTKEDEKTVADSITSSDALALARAQNVADSITMTDAFVLQSDHIALVQAPIVENLVSQLTPAEVKLYFNIVE